MLSWFLCLFRGFALFVLRAPRNDRCGCGTSTASLALLGFLVQGLAWCARSTFRSPAVYPVTSCSRLLVVLLPLRCLWPLLIGLRLSAFATPRLQSPRLSPCGSLRCSCFGSLHPVAPRSPFQSLRLSAAVVLNDHRSFKPQQDVSAVAYFVLF